MSILSVSFNSIAIREGQGTFIATFTLTPEAGDPETLPANFFAGRFRIVNASATAPDIELPNGRGGRLLFDDYGSLEPLEIVVPLLDSETELTEALLVRLEPEGEGVSVEGNGFIPLAILDECFLAGTQLLTEHGYRPVEELAIGDCVRTFDGKLEPIKWIGRQTRHRFTAHPQRSLPIQIKAGALGENMPHRDLFVSPDHAILFEGVLINAGALENGVSIVKTYPDVYVYYHIELEHHSLLDAEGAPAESFYPNSEDRATFDNCAEYDALYPEGNRGLMLWPLDYPRISSKTAVPRYMRKKLMDIAHQLISKDSNVLA